MNDEQIRAIEAINAYFISGNDIPVERATIRREEWELAKAALSAKSVLDEADLQFLLDEVKTLCQIICNSPPDTPIKGEIQSRAFMLGHFPPVLNANRSLSDAPQPPDDRVRELESKYNELIMAVACKFPDETRHETALRYIKNAEAPAVAVLGQSMKGETE